MAKFNEIELTKVQTEALIGIDNGDVTYDAITARTRNAMIEAGVVEADILDEGTDDEEHVLNITDAGEKFLREMEAAAAEKAEKRAASTDVKLTPKAENYTTHSDVKTASGAPVYDNCDAAADQMRGLTLDEQYNMVGDIMDIEVDVLLNGDAKSEYTKKLGKNFKGYGHLNPGMQRMNLGNKLRGHFTAIEKAEKREAEKAQKAAQKADADAAKNAENESEAAE